MGRHRGEDGPHTAPLGLLVARSRMHGDDSGKDGPRSALWAVAGVLTLAGLSGLTGWLFGHGAPNEIPVSQPTVWRVTVTPTPAPPRVIVKRVTLTPSPAPPPAARPRELVRWRTVTATPRPAPTVTRWKTTTATPPREGDSDGTTAIPGGEPGTEQ
ncbi:MAG TPA: hypothetical protein VFU47_03975 [Armatimonadota bacterium]|nr:hypothetical protein [Armatimonadota bacterium]